MSDIGALYGMIAVLGTGLLTFFGLFVRSRKPDERKTVSSHTGEVFTGSPNQGITILLREMKEIRDEIDEIKDWRRDFTGAIKRYLTKIARAWTNDQPMPGPDDDDLELLENVLPDSITRHL